MCPEGSRLFLLYRSLLPPVLTDGESLDSDETPRSLKSERARIAFEDHHRKCQVCQRGVETGAAYIKRVYNIDTPHQKGEYHGV